MNIHINQSFDVAAYLSHVKATHRRMISPPNAVRDSAAPRFIHRVDVGGQHMEEVAHPPEQPVKRSDQPKSEAVLAKIAAIQAVYAPGMSAREIGEALGVTKNVVVGFYRRNPDELAAYPLVASSGRKARGKERRTVVERVGV